MLALFFLNFIAFTVAQEALLTELTHATYDKFLHEHPMTLVMFYAPWCGKCPDTEEVLRAIAFEAKQKNSTLAVAKVDLSTEPKINDRYDFRKLPTLKFFFFQTPISYDGDMRPYTLRTWLKDVMKNEIEELSDMDHLRKILEMDFAVLLCTKLLNRKLVFRYKALQSNNNKISFFYTQMTNLTEINGSDKRHHFAIIRNFDDGIKWFSSNDEFTYPQMERMLKEYRYPQMITLNDENFENLFREYKNFIIRFRRSDSHGSDQEIDRLAKDYGKVIKFAKLDSDKDFGKELFSWLKLRVEDEASTYLLSIKNGPLEKFRLGGKNVVETEIANGILNYIDDKLQPHYVSEVPPKSNDGPVIKVVGSTFNEFVRKSTKPVLLVIKSKNCGACKNFKKIFRKLAEEFHDKKWVIFAEIEGPMNEVPGLEFDGFPTIYLFGPKMGPKGVRYFGKTEIGDLKSFLMAQTGHPFAKNEVTEQQRMAEL